ncbi:MAG TPA: malto-oligosyltrehalose synthase [Acidimicrobiales bacterium]|nr:malto-oligosyltrehalose synthase [Acidimicrobiales bacterium]
MTAARADQPDRPVPTVAPRCTYRVQLSPSFPFAAAEAMVPYLAELGVSHLYCSPILQAAPGSQHGYDVVDHSQINEELGGRAGFEGLCRTVAAHGMGILLDIVPNHMATAGRANAWWWDVLENGPASRYASHFDIDWNPPEEKLRQRVLVPVLGDHYGRVLEAGELRLCRQGGSFVVAYHDHEVPVSPRTLDELLADAARKAGSDELASLADAFGRLPHASETDRRSVAERHRDKEILRGRLEELCATRPDLAEAVDAAIERVNVDPDRLDAMLQRQNYRLAFWKVAGQELDYRRFFDIHNLVGLRTEDPAVFSDTHRLVLDLVAEGRVDGLRVDHPDGLADPEGYLDRVQRETGGAWLVVEKILGHDEDLRGWWPADGTTGYDYLNEVEGLFVDPSAEGEFDALYTAVADDPSSFESVALTSKLDVMYTTLAADVERLTALFVDACEWNRRYRDYTRVELRHALRELLAALDVYRTYVRPAGAATDEDRRVVTRALDRVRQRRPDMDQDLLELLENILLGRARGPAPAQLRQRFQQVSAAVMAKGVEDTAFYRYSRFVALNEVGGDPGRFGGSVEGFHRRNLRAAEAWPRTLLATSTHDTKRSEDVRARLAVLSEIPAEWTAAVARWRAHNGRHRRNGLPDGRAEYLLYQALVGAHPLPVDRAWAYMEKAAREAKIHTSWTEPDPAYEESLRCFVHNACADDEFTADLAGFAERIAGPGRTNSLAQTVLKLTSPGVPDIYRGNESWDLSLVDPDNRRPIDPDGLKALLDAAVQSGPEEALARAAAGLPKMLVVHRALEVRRQLADCFGPGSSYLPLVAEGAAAPHLVSYARGGRVIVAVPRLVVGLERRGGWHDARLDLPPGDWVDRMTGDHHAGVTGVGQLLGRFPVALLVKQ